MEKSTTFFCRQCKNIFRLPVSTGPPLNREVRCSLCESLDVEESPAWAPLGSGTNIFFESEWEYECRECHFQFKMPIPASPSEDKERKCPVCFNQHIDKLNFIGGEPLYCG